VVTQTPEVALLLLAELKIRVKQLDYMKDEFIVIGCDGLFDIFSNQEVIDFVRSKLLNSPIGE